MSKTLSAKVVGGAYTEAILDKNFYAISDFASQITDRFAHLEGHVAELSKLVSTKPTFIKVKSGKMFLLTVAVVSAYGGYKYAEKKIEDKRKEEQEKRWSAAYLNEKAKENSYEQMKRKDEPIPETESVDPDNHL